MSDEDDAIEYGYQEPVATLLTLGDVRGQPRYDYRSLGLGEGDVPELARLAADPELFWGDPASAVVWAPVHAWRALADLRAEGALDALIAVLSLPVKEQGDEVDDYDGWIGQELPEVFAAIGPAAFPVLADYLRDAGHHRWARTTTAAAIGLIGERYPALRDGAVAVLTEVVEATTDHPGPTTDDDEVLNGCLIADLVRLKAVESAPVIERAFAAERVDLILTGDWEDVQVDLGLLEERITPAHNYLMEQLLGDASPEVRDLLMGELDLRGAFGGAGLGAGWDDPGFDPTFDDEPRPKGAMTPAQIRQRQEAAKQKAKQKRKMAQQSKKQNRKKRK